MVVDSERDYYLQTWYDIDTGECVYRKEGRLSDPDMHGQSARRPRPPRRGLTSGPRLRRRQVTA